MIGRFTKFTVAFLFPIEKTLCLLGICYKVARIWLVMVNGCTNWLRAFKLKKITHETLHHYNLHHFNMQFG